VLGWKRGFGLDGVEKPSAAMKDFDFEPRANGQKPKAKSQKPKAKSQKPAASSMIVLFLIWLIANC
jgi:hypothetical protein